MKVTKYPQSCLLIEKDGRRIVIDPGSFFAQKYSLDELGDVQAVFYTHQHSDHLDEGLLGLLLAKGVRIYGNTDVVAKIGEGAREVKSGAGLTVAGFAVMPYDLPHCILVDGSDGPQNTGYIIDQTFFHPGDGIEADGLKIENSALPIAGPSISFYRAAKFATSLGAKKVIPIHYDFFVADPKLFAKFYTDSEVIVLEDGDSTEF